MKNIYLKSIIMYISSVLAFIFGKWDVVIKGLICFMILDYITGVISGVYLKELSSKRSFKGIVKKLLLLMIVAVATIIDNITNTEGFMRMTIMYFFIATEAISILENCVKCGIEIPKWIVDKLEQFKNNNELK